MPSLGLGSKPELRVQGNLRRGEIEQYTKRYIRSTIWKELSKVLPCLFGFFIKLSLHLVVLVLNIIEKWYAQVK